MGDIGDIDESIITSKKILLYWTHFVNEPEKNKNPNSKIDTTKKENYKDIKILKVVDKIVFK